jgi:hypothetical protein
MPQATSSSRRELENFNGKFFRISIKPIPLSVANSRGVGGGLLTEEKHLTGRGRQLPRLPYAGYGPASAMHIQLAYYTMLCIRGCMSCMHVICI